MGSAQKVKYLDFINKPVFLLFVSQSLYQRRKRIQKILTTAPSLRDLPHIKIGLEISKCLLKKTISAS